STVPAGRAARPVLVGDQGARTPEPAGEGRGSGGRRAPVDSLHMKADALRGHLDALLLAVLDDEPRHGYAIIEALQERSGGALNLPTGTVYPPLRSLEPACPRGSARSPRGRRDRPPDQLTPAAPRRSPP